MTTLSDILEIHSLSASFTHSKTSSDVLRLDKIHPVISGNKWFKLKYYLQDAASKNLNTILTFGGPYSNHIVATAFACKLQHIKCIGIIRGEKPEILSHTLQSAEHYGMELFFIDRTSYKNKIIPSQIDSEDLYIVPEGGYGKLGGKGAAEILDIIDLEKYSHIICACGTGTTLAGLVSNKKEYQKVIGINVLKGYEKITDDIKIIVDNTHQNLKFEINNDYHFGGYAKYNADLINFMNLLWVKEKIPTDFVYTGKLFFAVKQMILNDYFEKDSRLLIIHSGGLQGNLSLPDKTLLF